jgi:DNA-binding PadR family transcriptional regulator
MPTLPPLELHLMIALARASSYGYALMGEIERQSSGRLQPDIASLYRALGRLVDRGWAEEVAPPDAERTARGRPRRYYGLTPSGRLALEGEADRMAALAELARSSV